MFIAALFVVAKLIIADKWIKKVGYLYNGTTLNYSALKRDEIFIHGGSSRRTEEGTGQGAWNMSK